MLIAFPCEYAEHPWIQKENHAPNVNLGEHVRARIKQFGLMNKFKRKALRVSFCLCLKSEYRQSLPFLFIEIDCIVGNGAGGSG